MKLYAGGVLWLMRRGGDFNRIAWLLVGVSGVLVLTSGLLTRGRLGPAMFPPFALGHSIVQPFGFLLKALVALQACRFFVEARRSDTLETLLYTPLTSREILVGHRLALKRTFLGPVIGFLAVLVVPAGLQVLKAPTWNSPEVAGAAFQLVTGCWYGVLMVASGLVGGASFLPAGIGVVETSMTGLLLLMGTELPNAIAITLFSRLSILWLWVVIGLGFAFRMRLTTPKEELSAVREP